jgi:outer membrane protein OmpA-like peptidoglycan-associated protein
MLRKVPNWTSIFLLLAVMLSEVEASFSQIQNIPVFKTMHDSVFKAGDYVTIPFILFNFDSYALDHLSNPMDSLKLIADFLKKYDNLIVEIGNHNDYRTNSAVFSSKPSFKRAKTIVDTLIIHFHINPGQIYPIGYGETKPRVIDKDIILPSGNVLSKGTILTQIWIDKTHPESMNKDDYEFIMKLNRRTELKIVRTDFGKQ